MSFKIRRYTEFVYNTQENIIGRPMNFMAIQPLSDKDHEC